MINLGTIIEPWGKVAAVGITGGERYYWLINKHGTVSMIPATDIEEQRRRIWAYCSGPGTLAGSEDI